LPSLRGATESDGMEGRVGAEGEAEEEEEAAGGMRLGGKTPLVNLGLAGAGVEAEEGVKEEEEGEVVAVEASTKA